jgi:hypothetical protein
LIAAAPGSLMLLSCQCPGAARPLEAEPLAPNPERRLFYLFAAGV